MAKPILVIGMPMLTTKEHDEIYKALSERVPDYRVFAYKVPAEEVKFEVFHEKSMSEIEMDDLHADVGEALYVLHTFLLVGNKVQVFVYEFETDGPRGIHHADVADMRSGGNVKTVNRFIQHITGFIQHITGTFTVMREILGYSVFAYILFFFIFGGEFKLEIHYKEGFETLKEIFNRYTK